ncbi:MAG TPA: hypothetical protein VJN63_06315 [Thermoplasmata archaeon]|nr:hypothetical protein [Thermoplasmata archaeon]
MSWRRGDSEQERESGEETEQPAQPVKTVPTLPSRIRLDQAGVEDRLASISQELADRMADYGYRSRVEGDPVAGMWLKEMVHDLSGRLYGILVQYNLALAHRFKAIEVRYRRKPPMVYYHKMNELVHEAMSITQMIGKKSRPVSHDTGAGLSFLAGADSTRDVESEPR